MKKESPKRAKADKENGMLPEYDFANLKGGVRGKYYRAYREGYTVTIRKTDGTTEVQHFKPAHGVITLDQDVQKYFPDAESVNNALRGLIALLPQKSRRTKSGQRTPV